MMWMDNCCDGVPDIEIERAGGVAPAVAAGSIGPSGSDDHEELVSAQLESCRRIAFGGASGGRLWKLLRLVDMFQDLQDEHIAELIDGATTIMYEVGEVILQQGHRNNRVFVLLAGECVATVGSQQQIQECRRFKEIGNMFGEMSVLKRTPCAASVTAVTRVEVMCFSREQLERLRLMGSPDPQASSAGKSAKRIKKNRTRKHSPEDVDAVWKAKVCELSERGITAGDLLGFYAELGHSVMLHFDPHRSTTNDVVRGAVIPRSWKGGSDDGTAYATSRVGNRRCIAQRMVTHNWNNIFSHLVAAIIADALNAHSYTEVLRRLVVPEQLATLRRELTDFQVRYWVCAFCINQHASICAGFGPSPPEAAPEFAEYDKKRRDSVTQDIYTLCKCSTAKHFNDHRALCELNKFDSMMAQLWSEVPGMKQVIAVDISLHLFTRAWCVAELVEARLLNMPQSIKFHSKQSLEEAERLGDIKVQYCVAARPEDVTEIINKIGDAADIDNFNEEVNDLVFGDVQDGGILANWAQGRFKTDPRTLIKDYFGRGDGRGPSGLLEQQGLQLNEECASSWFAVFRANNQDAMRALLSGEARGIGSTVTAKVAQQGFLSGFVPFLQISQDGDKSSVLDAYCADATVKIFFQTKAARDLACGHLEGIASSIDAPVLYFDTFVPELYGLHVPERLLLDAYLMRPNLEAPSVGWESGLSSDPMLMSMNLQSLRCNSRPWVVLYQKDADDPMNAHGLVLAYADEHVQPMVAGLDTITIGSTGIAYEPFSEEQTNMAHCMLDSIAQILKEPSARSWTSRWLEASKLTKGIGFLHEKCACLLGDRTSSRIIHGLVQATSECQAVGEGAECFNFFFPCELSSGDEFFVVWDQFDEKPWDYMDEPGLRMFLQDRANEGFSFPVNPCWPVRDKGWIEVLQAIHANQHSVKGMATWGNSDLIKKIHMLHQQYPDGFYLA